MNRARIGDSIAAAGRNALVIGGVASGAWSAPAAMLLYLIENVVAVILAMLRVRMLAPPHEDPPGGKPRDRSKMLAMYLVVAGAFTLGEAVFILFFVLHILDEPLRFRAMAGGVGGIVAFEVIGLLVTLAMREPMTLAQADDVLTQPLGRVALLFFAVFIGVFAAGIVHDKWFVYPFVALKTAVDIGSLIPRRERRVTV